MRTKKSQETKKTKETKEIQETSEKESSQKGLSSLRIMKIVFFALIILIITMGTIIVSRKPVTKANIVIPVTTKESTFDFGIDTIALSKEDTKTYIFKITNYKKEKINQEEIPYHIIVENHTKNKISLKKNNEDKDLMTDQENTIIEGTLSKNSQEEVYYYVELISMEDENTKDFVYIQIMS